MQKIGPCLWFDGQAEEAANFYVSVFKNSRILDKSYYQEGMHKPAGSVLTIRFILDGETFIGLNGGPGLKFSHAISFVINCDTQAEVDEFWKKLSEGGAEVECGWVTDKYGVSWQIVPKAFMEMLSKPDQAAAQRALSAMMKMKKLDIAVLQRAYDNA